MPENSRFRREIRLKKTWAYESGDRVWIPACAGITGREGASAFAEFLTYMASLREGSRGEEVTAMGGWQWGRGWRDGEDRFFTTLRSVQNDMLGCEGGWVPAAARTTGGGWGDRLGRRFGVRKKGWVPAAARTTGGGGRPLGASLLDVGEEMGPRIREDNGWDWATARGVAFGCGRGDGSPHSETFAKLSKRIQIAVWNDSCHSKIKGFWIPAFAGMTVMQRSPFARTRTVGVGSRRRGNNGGAGVVGPLLQRDSSTPLRSARNDILGERVGGSRTAPTEGE